MKTIFFFLYSCCFPLFVIGQNWAPIVEDNLYNYGIVGEEGLTNTIKIDFTNDLGGTLAHYLNPTVVPCDSCVVETSLLAGQVQFLNEVMIEEENDVFLFTGSNNDTFQLISNAVLDQTWIFNIGNGTSATVAEINEINVLGQLDSVKTILLDSGEEILLSKNFGLLKFPDLLAGNGVIYELIGISNLGLGWTTPGFEDFFNWAPGMVLMYEELRGGQGNSTATFRKQTVKEVHTGADSVRVIVEEVSRKYTYFYGWLVDTLLGVFPEKEIIFYRDQFPGVDHQINELANNLTPEAGTYDQYFTPVQIEEQSDGRVSKILGTLNYDEALIYTQDFNNPSLYHITDDWLYQFYIEYKEGLGLVNRKYGIIEVSGSDELIGYEIDGIVQGLILSDDEILLTTSVEDRPTRFEIKTFPNPAYDQVHILFGRATYGSTHLQVVNNQGVIIETREVPSGVSHLTLEISHWPTGNYWLQVMGETWQKGKFVQKR